MVLNTVFYPLKIFSTIQTLFLQQQALDHQGHEGPSGQGAGGSTTWADVLNLFFNRFYTFVGVYGLIIKLS